MSTVDDPGAAGPGRDAGGRTGPDGWIIRAIRLAPFAALLVAAAALRFYDLGFRSLWLDEVFTAQVVRLPDVGSVIQYLETDPGSTPLHYLLTWLLRPLGVNEFAIRLPYAVAGVAAVLALAALVARLYGRVTGIAAGVLMAILPFAIFYSQESRPYSLFMLLSPLAMLAAYRAAASRRARDWVLLAVPCALDLYTGYLAIAIILAAYAYVAIVFAVEGVGAWRSSGPRPAAAALRGRVGLAVGSAALIGIAFLPLANNFDVFLQHRELAFGRATAGARPTIDAASTLLAQLDFHGWLFWLLAVGVGWAVIEAIRGRWRNALVLPTWLFVPLLGFAIGTGGGIVTIWPRYFGAIYPAGVALAAVGIDGLARTAAALVRLGGRLVDRGTAGAGSAPLRLPALSSAARIVLTTGLCCLVALDALPADAAAYTRAKGSDYRGAVDAILGIDPVRPVVLVVGDNPTWQESGLGYYAWARGSHLTVLDALQLNADELAAVGRATSVWAAALNTFSTPPTVTDTSIAGSLFNDVWVVRAAKPPAAPIDQARAVLTWASTFEPQVTATLQLMDVLQGHAATGRELLPAPSASQPEGGTEPLDRWILQPGASVAQDGQSFALRPGGGSINALLSTTKLRAGGAYVISFTCDATGLAGTAAVYVVANEPSGQTAFPNGAGYDCQGGSAADHGVFAFTLPRDAASATVWLRATGSGSATYRDVSIRALQ